MTRRPQHAVTLISIEDDARDEQLRVVWKLERGAVAHDQHILPDPADGFDNPRQLDAFLDAVRWGAIASAAKTVLQAPFRSGIKIDDYQLDPVVPSFSSTRWQARPLPSCLNERPRGWLRRFRVAFSKSTNTHSHAKNQECESYGDV